jgi:two-component system nitrogen regulation response regulator GlnG
VLAHTGGNQLKAAEILGLNRNTLRKKLAGLGIEQARKRAGREDRALDGK